LSYRSRVLDLNFAGRNHGMGNVVRWSRSGHVVVPSVNLEFRRWKTKMPIVYLQVGRAGDRAFVKGSRMAADKERPRFDTDSAGD